MAGGRARLILASGSDERLRLLRRVGIEPDRRVPAMLDESRRRKERPRMLAVRLAWEKAESVRGRIVTEEGACLDYVLAADTVVATERCIFGKPASLDEAAFFLRSLSGRVHRVFTGVCLIAPDGRRAERLVETRLRLKRLSERELSSYLLSHEWSGKAGAYAIQGRAGAFVTKLFGSYSNVVGLPLYETLALLEGMGYSVS